MKVKGWAVVSKRNKIVWDFFYLKHKAILQKEQYERNTPIYFAVKPCILTIKEGK